MANIVLQSVNVDFPIYHAKSRSLKNKILGIGRNEQRRIQNHGSNHVSVAALRDINLELRNGDRLGIIGRNGAGKTTLLRVLSGIYEPTSGLINIDGVVSSLTDIALGMDPEATGYENIFMRGIFLGMSKAQAKSIIPDIENFTELGAHLDLPVRTYSSGMLLRLAFAVSTCIRPDILIMDEMIGAGDMHFVEKARQRVDSLLESVRILALASHDNGIIRKFCNRAIFVDEGRIVQFGPVDEVISAYERAAS